MPAPNVDSCVIRLDVKKELPLSGDAEKKLFKVVHGAFSQRRKTLQNTLGSSLSLPKPVVAESLEQVGLKTTARAEELSLEQFIRLSEIL